MQIHADFSSPVIVPGDPLVWVASPQAGVERVMLDRIGAEQARATSLVRYAPASDFPAHGHPGGEEILVLDGVFSDETGDYPAGIYLRNPPGSAHRPSSREGALIFVKLRQMCPDDQASVRIDTRNPAAWTPDDRPAPGGSAVHLREVCALHRHPGEQVDLLRIGAGQPVFDGAIDGAELLVLAGSLQVGPTRCQPRSWIRLPGGRYEVTAGPEGATVYRKLGMLGQFCEPGD